MAMTLRFFPPLPQALDYRQRIMDAVPSSVKGGAEADFSPLMVMYLTDR